MFAALKGWMVNAPALPSAPNGQDRAEKPPAGNAPPTDRVSAIPLVPAAPAAAGAGQRAPQRASTPRANGPAPAPTATHQTRGLGTPRDALAALREEHKALASRMQPLAEALRAQHGQAPAPEASSRQEGEVGEPLGADHVCLLASRAVELAQRTGDALEGLAWHSAALAAGQTWRVLVQPNATGAAGAIIYHQGVRCPAGWEPIGYAINTAGRGHLILRRPEDART